MKKFQTTTEMVQLLRDRGLVVEDESAAERALLNENYYRLSGFFRQLQVDHRGGDTTFVEGSTFEQALRLHRADRRFARICGEALADIECSVRSRFAYFAAESGGSTAFYLDPAYYYTSMPELNAHLDSVRRELERSKSAMVARYRDAKGDVLGVPVWVAVEVLPFGSISRMIEYAADSSAARATANSVSHQWEPFASTVHSLAVFRNRCAHHGQNWHRTLDLQTPRKKSDLRKALDHDAQGAYPAILAMKRLSKGVDAHPAPYAEIDALFDSDTEFRDGILFPDPK